MTNIIVPKEGIQVHCFDLYGTLVDQNIMGKKTLDAFKELVDMPEEEKQKAIDDYNALSAGEDWAVVPEVKGRIIDAVRGPLKASGFEESYVGGFYQDGLDVLDIILTHGQRAIVFNTRFNPAVGRDLPNGMGSRMGFYAPDMLDTASAKSDPQSFQEVYDREAALGGRVISHSADELPELEAAVQSGLFGANTVYVNRGNGKSEQEARSIGVEHYVRKLTEVQYVEME